MWSRHPSRLPTARGLSLGWRLGLTASAIVLFVLSGLMGLQQMQEIRRWRVDRQKLMSESLAPLVSDIEAAANIRDIKARLVAFEHAYSRGDYPHHRVVLLDRNGGIVASSHDGPNADLPAQLLSASAPVTSPLLPGGTGRLVVRQDASQFETSIAHFWRMQLLSIGVTVVCLLVALQLANRYLVTRPLALLLDAVRKMEKGYASDMRIATGAWEIRWLAHRIRDLTRELERTARRLVDAERRSWLAQGGSGLRPPLPPPLAVPVPLVPPPPGAGETHRRLEGLARTLESLSPHDAAATTLAWRAWHLDSFEAERLGDYRLKSRIEDASFRILDPGGYARLNRTLERLTAAHRDWMVQTESEIREALDSLEVPHLAIHHRIKHAASLWRKIQAKGLAPEQVQDVFAFRIIVSREDDCYRALRAIHLRFNPQVLRFKDYVAHPKPNGYRSLHTSVSREDGLVFEIQIRTREMHEEAEAGLAAHWRYSAIETKAPSELTDGSRRRLRRRGATRHTPPASPRER